MNCPYCNEDIQIEGKIIYHSNGNIRWELKFSKRGSELEVLHIQG